MAECPGGQGRACPGRQLAVQPRSRQAHAVAAVAHAQLHAAGRAIGAVEARMVGGHVRIIEHDVAGQVAAHGHRPMQDVDRLQAAAVVLEDLDQCEPFHP